MRDIRGDLQDRASLLEEQINNAEAHFDKLVEQLRAEHESRLEDLKAELAAVSRLMEVELRRLGNLQVAAAKAQAPQPAPQPSHHHQPSHQASHQASHQPSHQPSPQASSQQPLADFLVRKLSEVGAMSRDDLRRLSMQEGYFADAESAERGVTTTLLNVVKAGLIRQLPNGNFAPATVLDTIRLRRAM
jgi:Tfp pilus assembly protein PilP